MGCWNLVFTRQINDWELGEVEGLLRRLQRQIIKRVQDVMVWRLLKEGTFLVKSFYSSLVGCYLKGFPISMVWNPWMSMRVSFFAWEAVWEKILTLDLLRMRGWSLPNRCYWCKGQVEWTNHILLHCPKAIVLWHLIFAIFGVQWVMLFSI